MNNRITNHQVLGQLKERKEVNFTFDNKSFTGYEGDTIASALLANGIRTLRVHEESGTARGIYCNIGHCFECRVTVNNRRGVRACLQLIEDGMIVKSGKVQPAPFRGVDEDEFPKTYAQFQKMDVKGDNLNE